MLLSSVHFHLFLTASDQASQRYVNGLVSMLISHGPVPDAAVYVRIEGTSSSDQPDAQRQPPASPYGIVYLENGQLTLHMLSAAPSAIPADTAISDSELPSLASERKFLIWHAQQQHMREQQKLAQAKSRAVKRQPSTITRPKSRMTLADIEQFAQGVSEPQTSPPPATAIEAKPDKDIEEQNKSTAKQLIIAALKERQIFRAHKDFATLWSLIYKSCKFALRDKIGCQALSLGDLKREVEKHTAFYCPK
ncbi:hypothetical protein EC988_000360 [Linderina pennispora]|nr:hypothetical protein EC988_000360 [Linderina pennispora]